MTFFTRFAWLGLSSGSLPFKILTNSALL